MKKLLFALLILISCSFNIERKLSASDTWAGTADNQLPTGNALRDGGFENGSNPIPSAYNKKALTVSQLTTYTTIPTNNSPLVAMSSTHCPTKADINSSF